MILQREPRLDLTYCLNVHPGETWTENFAAIREKALAVRGLVAPGRPFGLGLRLGKRAATELALSGAREEFAAFMAAENLYAMTINGFPYGQFHGTRVKEGVYRPDWQTPERLAYTNLLADILADLLPEGAVGSISTVPGTFKSWVEDESAAAMARLLAECAGHLADILERTGKEIHLGLEPEPGCFLEATAETVAFFNGSLLSEGVSHLESGRGWSCARAGEAVRRHIGVCLDTCHTAIQFEDIPEALACYEREGIRVSKVQLSAALRVAPGEEALRALLPFCEPVYLHQVKARQSSGEMLSWLDLPDALRDAPGFRELEEMRIHFHVPLFFQEDGVLETTAAALDDAFFRRLRQGGSPHLEIETYTFDVLPPAIRGGDIAESIAREYGWVLERLL